MCSLIKFHSLFLGHTNDQTSRSNLGGLESNMFCVTTKRQKSLWSRKQGTRLYQVHFKVRPSRLLTADPKFSSLFRYFPHHNLKIHKQINNIYLSFSYLPLRDFFGCSTFNSQTIQMFSSKIYHTLIRCARFDGLLLCFFAVCQ